MAVLLLCFTYHSVRCCGLGTIFYHVLPIIVSGAVDLAVLLLSFIYHRVYCCILGSIVAMFLLSQCLQLYIWQYCCHVLPITVYDAVCLAVLLPFLPITVFVSVDFAVLFPCFTYHSVSCCRLGSIFAMFLLSQCLLLWTCQYCYHVLSVTVSAAVDLAVLLPCFTYHSVCCCRTGSVVTLFYLSQCLLL